MIKINEQQPNITTENIILILSPLLITLIKRGTIINFISNSIDLFSYHLNNCTTLFKIRDEIKKINEQKINK